MDVVDEMVSSWTWKATALRDPQLESRIAEASQLWDEKEARREAARAKATKCARAVWKDCTLEVEKPGSSKMYYALHGMAGFFWVCDPWGGRTPLDVTRYCYLFPGIKPEAVFKSIRKV